MSELKRCPFCGGEAHVETHKFYEEKTKDFTLKTYGIICDNCHTCGCQHYSNEEEAIKAWNTRKPMERILERLEELYKYNEEQADIYKDGNGAYMREKKEMYMDRANCYGVAIRTVKEGGGIE